MRRQYHLQPNPGGPGRQAWDVSNLIEASRSLPVIEVELTTFDDVLDTVYWFDDVNLPTVRSVAEHARLIAAADLAYPIILGADGRLMDGMHRVCRAVSEGAHTIAAVRFEVDPRPDFVGVEPSDLDYD